MTTANTQPKASTHEAPFLAPEIHQKAGSAEQTPLSASPLRDACKAAFELLTNPDAEPCDADAVITQLLNALAADAQQGASHE